MLQLVENVKLRFNHEMKAERWRLRPKRVNNYLPSPVLEHDNNQDVRIFNHSLAFGLYKHVGQGFVKIKSVNVQTFTSILSKKKTNLEAYCPYQSFAVRFSRLVPFKGVWQGKMFQKDTPHNSSLSAESCLPPH